MQTNEIINRLPKHLLNFVVNQPYDEYTAQEHAVWRYVMKQNTEYLSKVAHESYFDGLKRSGIGIDKIPHVEEMNHFLKKIGWAAVVVDGFIPPAVFMKFQAYNVLVIAADIRSIDHIEYTPAPDIIHEAAGHAPIIADTEYAEYLRLFGEIGCKAFSSENDYNTYEAVRHLSILKADPNTSKNELLDAEKLLAKLKEPEVPLSEMTMIRNLHWWTVEYGLIGDINDPKIYGAGLLSSIGESYTSLQPHVKKIPYTIDACNCNFDITTQQPQLFVTPDFKHLSNVLNEFAECLAFKRGGIYGLEKAIESKNIATIVYSSGLQISGAFSDIIKENNELVYVRTSGPTNLNYDDLQLKGHAKEYHKDGFGSPVGKLKKQDKPLELFSDVELRSFGIDTGEKVNLEFQTRVKVSGRLDNILRKNGKILIMSFSDCNVRFNDEVLFEPTWGIYDMAVGERIISAFSGPADPDSYRLKFEAPNEKTHKIEYSDQEKSLHDLYQKVRELRDNGSDLEKLKTIFENLKQNYADDWLLPLEILELVIKDKNLSFEAEIREYLSNLKNRTPEYTRLIENGIEIMMLG